MRATLRLAISTMLISMLTPLAVADLSVLPHGAGAPALVAPYFPDRCHEFIWRNWDAVPPAKIAAMLGNDFSKAVMADGSLEVDLEKFARVAKTLPRNDALLLERAIASAGEAIEQPTLATVS